MFKGRLMTIRRVNDLARAKAVFSALLADGPEMVRPRGTADGTGQVTFHQVADIAATHAALLHVGATPLDPISDVDGRLVGSVRFADGNVIGLKQG